MKKLKITALFVSVAMCSNVFAATQTPQKNVSPHLLTSAMESTADLYKYHVPEINFTELKKHVLTSISLVKMDLNTTNRTIFDKYMMTMPDPLSIQSLMNNERLVEQELSKLSKKDIRIVDIVLSQNILSVKDDPYTRFAQTTLTKYRNISDGQTDIVTTFDNGDMKISSFNAPQCKLLTTATRDGMRVDLRNNGGGTIQCALDALGAFLPTGRHLVGRLVTRYTTQGLYVDGSKESKIRGTLMVNKMTASSAEFFTRVLKKRGWKIDGGKTYGKIVTQYQLPSINGKIYITFGHYEVI